MAGVSDSSCLFYLKEVNKMGTLIYVCGALFLANAGFSVYWLLKDKWDRATFHIVVAIWMWYITIM